jgi:outer membrane protein assembly factor BamB
VYPSSEWPEYRRDDQRSGFNPGQTLITKANVATLAPKWISTTPAGTFANPVVVNGTVYKADLGGHIVALSESTGAVEWTFYEGAGSDSFIGTPAYSNGVLYEGSNKGNFYALNATTGAMIAQYPFTIQYMSYESSPVVAGGRVFVGVTDSNEDAKQCISSDQFVAFSTQSPTMINGLTTTPAGSSGASVWSSPMIDPQGFAYLATGNSCTGPALNTGDAILKVGPENMKLIWDEQGPVDGHDLDYGATPIYVNGMVVDGSKDGNIYAYSTATGGLVWKTNAGIVAGSIIGSPATDGTHIYVPFVEAPTGGAVVALNLNGSVAWTLPTATDADGFGVLSAPAVSQGMVFVAYKDLSCSGNQCFGISALDAATGSVLWRYTTTHTMYAGPVIVDGGLFVGEFDGSSYYCFTPNGV